MRDVHVKNLSIALLLGINMYLPTMAWSTSQFVASWGAVAISSSKADAIGTSFDQPSKAQAKQQAIQACEKVYKTQCEVEQSFYNKCIGIAATQTNHEKFYFSTEKYDKTQLKQIRKLVSAEAITRCENKTGSKCKEVNAYCTGHIYQK